MTISKREDTRPTSELFDTAIRGDDEASEDAIAVLRFRGTREVFERAVQLCSSDNADERNVGVLVLSQLGIPERVFAQESTLILLDMLQKETDLNILSCIGWGLGHLGTSERVAPLAAFKNHPDPDVRLAVVGGLQADESDLAIETLIQLSADVDSEVRNWATFALGSQIDVDRRDIREALYQRISDNHEETHLEAICGLAKRRDLRVLDIIADWLRAERPYYLAIDAARDIGHPKLVPLLQELKTSWTERVEQIEEAIQSCNKSEEDKS